MISRITGRNVASLTADSKLEDELNLSSMDRVELMSALEDSYQVDLSEANFANLTTVGELERLLQQPEKPARSGYRYPHQTLRMADYLDPHRDLQPAVFARHPYHGGIRA